MQKKKIIYIALGLILGILVICAYLYIFNNLKTSEELSQSYDFKVIADSYDTTGLDLNSGFIITANDDHSVSDVKEVLTVSPEMEYDLSKTGFRDPNPKEELLSNSIYNIYIHAGEETSSWAFQTKSEFKVLSSIPMNDSICINLDTGIQIDFSKKVDSINKFFEISPQIDGTFKYVGKTVTFVPEEELTDGEVYTVTVKIGLSSIDGDKLKEDYTFSFKTEEYQFQSEKLFLRSEKENFSTANTQAISFAYGKKDFMGEIFNVNVYDLKSHENYLTALKSEEIDITGYEIIRTFNDHLIYDTNSYNNAYIKLPENLPVGWYVAEVTNEANNINLKQLIQVSDIAVYLQGVKGDALIWCNDIQTGDVLANTDVRIGDKSLKTNDNGVALFKAEGKNEIVVSLADGRHFAEYIDFSTDFENAKYNVYVYTDRESYKPTDTINYWGIIVAKDAKEKLPKTIELYLGEQLIKENIPVNSSGIFTGSFDIENQISMYNEIYAGIGKAHYYAKGIIIEDYIKPSYILGFDFDKEYYRRNDVATINIAGSYFDGNPASNLDLNLRIGNDTESVRLDEMGTETIQYALNNINKEIWEPAYIYTELHTSGADEDANIGKTFLYCPTDYALDTEVTENELIIKSSLIDFNKVKVGYLTEDLIGQPCGDVSGKVKVYRTDYIKTENGTYYDFINKTNKTKYKYSTKKTLVDTFDFTTNSTGVAAIPLEYEKTDDCYYSFEMNYTMPDGFNGKMSGSLSANIYPNNDTYYYFESDKSDLKTNEETLVKIMGSNGFRNDGRVLYSLLNEEIQEVALTKSTEFKFKFDEKYIPNILLVGVYFDGTDFYTINQRYFYYNYEEKDLDITITTDRESYAPGDTVKLNIETKDKNGKSDNTNMVISVVDEAAFAINEQYPDPLPDLYAWEWYYPMTYISTNVRNEDFIGGEGGGAGDDGTYRDYFKDTAAFLTIKTGSNGKTSASFKLPDNTTSWRITVVGITDNLKAGYKTHNIVSTLPFYTNIVMNEKYNIGDDITFSLKSAGENLPLLSSSIKYEVKIIKDEEVINTEKVYQLPFKSVNVNMGKVLIAGDYKVEVKSECGIYKDTFIKEFTVENSLHEINIVKDVDFANKIDIDAVKYPVTLTFYDINNKLYYDVVDKILSTSIGVTNDQKLAYNEVTKKLGYIKEKDIRDLQDYDGGIKILNYSGSDAMLTAKICAIIPEYIDTIAAKRYLNYVIESEQTSFEQKTAAYFGLASLKEPVLNDIRYLLANSSDFSIQEKLNLITGLAYIGDYEGATKYYTELIKPRIRKTEEDAYIYSYDKYESYSTTSFLTVLLAKLNHEDFNLVANHVVNNKSKEYTPALDLVEYIRHYNPKTDSVGYVKYAIDGEETTVNFTEESNHIVRLTERELKKFEILENKEVAGKIMYIGTISDAATLYENNIKIEKTISGGSAVGDVRTVTIKVKMPKDLEKEDYLVVNDVIPSGMRFVGTDNWHFKDAQKVRFIISNYDKKSEYVIKYSVRNVLKGEYAVESAVVVNPETNEIGFTGEDNIVVE